MKRSSLVNTIITSDKMKTSKNLIGIGEIKATLQQGLFSLHGIELNDHGFNVTTRM